MAGVFSLSVVLCGFLGRYLGDLMGSGIEYVRSLCVQTNMTGREESPRITTNFSVAIPRLLLKSFLW